MQKQISRAVVIAGGNLRDPVKMKRMLRADDFIICADSGYRHALDMNVSPHVVLGDFDSCARPSGGAFTVLEYPPEKDYSDTFLAAEYARNAGYREILFLGCLGSRFDHMLANFRLLGHLLDQGVRGVLLDEINEIFLIRGRETLKGKPGDKIALIPFEGTATASATGLLYPLHHLELSYTVCSGISNELTGESAQVVAERGTLAVIRFSED